MRPLINMQKAIIYSLVLFGSLTLPLLAWAEVPVVEGTPTYGSPAPTDPDPMATPESAEPDPYQDQPEINNQTAQTQPMIQDNGSSQSGMMVQEGPPQISQNNSNQGSQSSENTPMIQQGQKIEGKPVIDHWTEQQKMQAEMQALRGQLEEQTHQVETLKQEHQKLVQELAQAKTPGTSANTNSNASTEDTAATPAVPVKIAAKTEKSESVADEETEPKAKTKTAASKNPAEIDDPADADVLRQQKLYQLALRQMKSSSYPQATKTLQDYVKKYPKGKYTATSHYWLGELFLLQDKPTQATGSFQKLVTSYSDNSKVPNALMRLGSIYQDKGNKAKAKTQFQAVIKRFPGTPFAKEAKEKLLHLK